MNRFYITNSFHRFLFHFFWLVTVGHVLWISHFHFFFDKLSTASNKTKTSHLQIFWPPLMTVITSLALRGLLAPRPQPLPTGSASLWLRTISNPNVSFLACTALLPSFVCLLAYSVIPKLVSKRFLTMIRTIHFRPVSTHSSAAFPYWCASPSRIVFLEFCARLLVRVQVFKGGGEKYMKAREKRVKRREKRGKWWKRRVRCKRE